MYRAFSRNPTGIKSRQRVSVLDSLRQQTIFVDNRALLRAVKNLLSNAARFAQQEIHLSLNESDGQLFLVVEDDGPGIAQDDIERIFEPFTQVNNQERNSEKGHGLGLAIVRRLTNLLEHRIDVESDPGKGSRFTVALPMIADSAVHLVDESEDETRVAGVGSGLIILIEDDVSVANAWGLLLEAEGYTVATAASATEASALIEHIDQPPRLLISDFHLLDGSTGVQAVSLIRKYYDFNIPAFIVSGDTSKVVKDARLIDNCTLLSKPVDTSRLLLAARHATHTGTVPQD